MRLTPTFLDGAMLAIGAVPDVLAVVDAHRCELERAFKHDRVHDLYSFLEGDGPYSRNQRVLAVRWNRAQDAIGTEDELRRLLVHVATANPGRPILLLRGIVSLLMHTDLHGLVISLREEVGNPLLVVDQDSTDDDWMDGWAAVEEAILGHIERPDGERRPVVAGLGLFRLEGDEVGNLDEVRRLLGLAGIEDASWPLGGGGISGVAVHPDAPRFRFPYARPPGGPPGRDVDLDLPMGFAATCRMLRVLAEWRQAPQSIESIVDRERERIRARLEPLVTRRLAGRAAVVVAEPCRAAGIHDMLRELGMDVPLAILLRRAGVQCRERDALQAAGVEVWTDPDYAAVRERLADAAVRDECDVMVGSGTFNDAAERAGLGIVELGYPFYAEHFTAHEPFMGFDGLLRFADRVGNAVARRQLRRANA